jgi:PAS domain-containing protein
MPLLPKMPLPWRESSMIGALICDISGTIIDANYFMSKCLGYPEMDSLLGKCVWRDLLSSRADWSPWKEVAGDMTALLHQSIGITAKNGQILWMNVEVFAAPSFPSHLQAVFVDQTELAFLTDKNAHCRQTRD